MAIGTVAMKDRTLDTILFPSRKKPTLATAKQCARIYEAGREKWGLTVPQTQEKCQQLFGKRWPDDLTFEEAKEFLKVLGKEKQ